MHTPPTLAVVVRAGLPLAALCPPVRALGRTVDRIVVMSEQP